jgi:hypothetical protein
MRTDGRIDMAKTIGIFSQSFVANTPEGVSKPLAPTGRNENERIENAGVAPQFRVSQSACYSILKPNAFPHTCKSQCSDFEVFTEVHICTVICFMTPDFVVGV